MEYTKSMNVKEYNDFVKSMKVYPEKYALIYPALGLVGEAGEVSEKVKKWIRGDKDVHYLPSTGSKDDPLGQRGKDSMDLLKEVSDVLWYVTSFADDMGYTLQDVINANVEKLTSRKERGVLKGSGDNR
jgi:NTP pyrophosphatase (non-canonical NTP hydrolase)